MRAFLASDRAKLCVSATGRRRSESNFNQNRRNVVKLRNGLLYIVWCVGLLIPVIPTVATSETSDETTKSKIGNWLYESTIDAFQDRKAYTASIRSTKGPEQFVVYCNPHYDPKTRETDKAFGGYFHLSVVTLNNFIDDGVFRNVKYRIDDQPVTNADWQYENGTVADLNPDDVLPLLSKLEKSHRLRVRLFVDDDHQFDYEFDLSNISTVLKKLSIDCESSFKR